MDWTDNVVRIKRISDDVRTKVEIMTEDLSRIYSTTEERLNTVLDTRNSEVWRMIRTARKDWESEIIQETFWDYLEKEAGILVELNNHGDIKLPAKVIDDEKFLIFVLRYK